MAVRSERKDIASRPAVARVNIPTESAARFDFLRALDTGHQFDGFTFENTHSIQFAAIQEHAGVAGQIGSGAEQTGMTRDTSHPPSGGIVNFTAQICFSDLFRGRDASRLNRKEASFEHFERLKKFGLG